MTDATHQSLLGFAAEQMTAKGLPISIPADFAKDTETREGKAGRAWLEALPSMVEELCQRWQLVINGSVMNGYTGLAIPVQQDREECILKVYWRDSDTDRAPLALKVWDGRGAVKLLAHEPSLGAMLLERLDPDLSLEKVEINEAIIVAGQLLRRLAIPAPAQMLSLTEFAAKMTQSMPQRWEQYGRPFSRQLLDQACEWTAQLGPACNWLMTDYDLHYTDVLAGHREPWLMIDPKALAGDPEFSLAELLWSRLEDIEAKHGLEYHFRSLVEAAELDYELACTWTIIRCVDYWLWGLTVDLTNDPARCDIIIKRLNSR